MSKQLKFIAAMGIVEFAREVQNAFEEGYRFDFEDNARVPNTFGALMEATMVKAEAETTVTPEAETTVTPEAETQKSEEKPSEVKVDGRKRKARENSEPKAEGGSDT